MGNTALGGYAAFTGDQIDSLDLHEHVIYSFLRTGRALDVCRRPGLQSASKLAAYSIELVLLDFGRSSYSPAG